MHDLLQVTKGLPSPFVNNRRPSAAKWDSRMEQGISEPVGSVTGVGAACAAARTATSRNIVTSMPRSQRIDVAAAIKSLIYIRETIVGVKCLCRHMTS